MASSSHGAVAGPLPAMPTVGQRGPLLVLPAPSPWVAGASTSVCLPSSGLLGGAWVLQSQCGAGPGVGVLRERPHL